MRGTSSHYRSIVAVTGLNGHAYGSWRGRGTSQRMWLCDFMRKDFPDCRTMIYGYNSKLDAHGTHTILDYAKTFLEELTKARAWDEEVRSARYSVLRSAEMTCCCRGTRDPSCSLAIASGAS